MSQITLSPPVAIETEAVTDAAQLLAWARATIQASPVRNLEREALAAGLDAMAARSWTPNFKTIDGGVLVMTPPILWTQLLIEARRLGVL